MALTNPSKLINVQELQYFEGKLAAKYQTQAIDVSGISASTVEGALGELASAISSLPSAIVPKGTKTFAQLTPSTDLAAANVGFMWNISDAFTTTADFVEGAGVSIPAGANVYVANPSTGVYKYDIFQGMYDLSGYATKVSGATSGNFAGLDGNGNLTDSGSKASDFATADHVHGNITNAGALQTTDVTIADGDKLVITDASDSGKVARASVAFDGSTTSKALTPKGTFEDFLQSHQDISGKADKVSGATTGNFAGLDANGNLTDSGKKAADFQAAGDYKTTQTAVTDPTAGSATDTLNFIATISQNANGEITATKQPVRSASASQSGLMSAAHYSKLDAIAYAADSDIDEIFGDSSDSSN